MADAAPLITELPASECESGAASRLWSGLVAVSLGHLAVDLCTGIWPVYKTLAMLDLTKAGLIATLGSVIGNGLQPVFGVLADRGGRRLLLSAGLLLAGAVVFAPYVTGLLHLFVLVLLTSVGSAAFHPAGTGASSSFSQRRTGVMVAVFLTGGYLGYGLSQLAFTTTYHRMQGSTAILFVVPLVASAAVAWKVPPSSSRGQSLAEWGRTLVARSGSLRALFVVQFLASTINIALTFLLPDLMLARHAPSWMVQGGGHAALVLGGALSLLPAGYLADRFGAKRVLLVTNLISGAFLLGLIAGPNDAVFELAMTAGFGAFNGANGVVAVSEGNRAFPGQGSAVSALLMGLPWCFASLGAMLAGVLADPAHGGSPAFALGWIGLCAPAALLASTRIAPRQTAGV